MASSSTFHIRQSSTALFRALVSQYPAVILVRAGTKRVQQGTRLVTISPASIGVLPAHVPLTIENQPSLTGPYAASLLIPAIGIGFAVQDPNTSYVTMLILALLCGFGGGNFASSMSNISFFYPKAQQGTALGLNAGLGNLGVSVMQFCVPLVITFGVFGMVGGQAQTLPDGSQLWLQNAGFIWVPLDIANIHGMPGVGRMFALPKMKKYSHRIILGDDADLITRFPEQTGKVTVLTLDGDKVTAIRFWTPESEPIDSLLK